MSLVCAIAVALLIETAAPERGPIGICAHRGDKKVTPENTIPAFQSAVRKGAHMIELDVAPTSDGRLIIMHDRTLDRTTNGSGAVSDHTFDEIRALDAGSWFNEEFAGTQVPTLEEALEVIPPQILCNVHLRGDARVGEESARVIARMGRLKHCFLACSREQAEAARKVAPSIMICNMDRQGGDREAYVRTTIEMNAQFIQLRGEEEGLKELVENCRRNNVKVNYFGTEDPEKMKRLVDMGVNYILTDDLDTGLRVLKEDYGVKPVKLPKQETDPADTP